MESLVTRWYWASARYVLIQDEVETSTDLKERIVFLVSRGRCASENPCI